MQAQTCFNCAYGESKSVAVNCTTSSSGSSNINTLRVGVILAHGAGGNSDSGLLPQYTQSFADAGFPCVRFTCKPINLKTRATALQAVLSILAQRSETQHVTHWILGGHSMGARVAAEVAADPGPHSVIACVFSSYPLHPPGKQDQLRDTPLCSLQLPLLFLRGTCDPFCEAGPFAEVIPRLTSRALQVHTVTSGDHGLKIKGGAAANTANAAELCSQAVAFVTAVAKGDLGSIPRNTCSRSDVADDLHDAAGEAWLAARDAAGSAEAEQKAKKATGGRSRQRKQQDSGEAASPKPRRAASKRTRARVAAALTEKETAGAAVDGGRAPVQQSAEGQQPRGRKRLKAAENSQVPALASAAETGTSVKATRARGQQKAAHKARKSDSDMPAQTSAGSGKGARTRHGPEC